MKLEYNGYVSFETLKQPYEVISDYATYMELMNEGMLNSNKDAPFSQATIDLWREKSKDPNGLTNGVPNYLAYLIVIFLMYIKQEFLINTIFRPREGVKN